jgi:cysteine-rich repeat protein
MRAPATAASLLLLGLSSGCPDEGARSDPALTFTPTASAGMDGSGSAEADDDGGPSPDDDGGDGDGDSIGDDTGPCTVGTEGCPCFQGGACEAAFECVDEVCTSVAACANGRVEGLEECDDGNVRGGDGCEADCTFTPGAAAISAGASHTCVLLHSGAVRCWGDGFAGRLGYGDERVIGDDESPVDAGDIALGGVATAIAAGGSHTCAILEGGAVRCWGNGESGRLGYGNTESIGDDEDPEAAGDVPLGSAAEAISAGGSHTCALLVDGSVRCWGSAVSGKLGVPGSGDIGDDEPASAAAVVQLGGHAATVDLGVNHTCATRADGAALCWGSGGFGRLGIGTTADVGDDETPVSVGPIDLGGATIAFAGAGASHSCVRTAVGGVHCFGFNDFGQLGHADTLEIGDNEPPIGPLALGAAISEIGLGGDHACARSEAGDVICWGRGNFGQLGYGNVDNVGDGETPASVGPVDLGGAATAIAVGGGHSCALLQSGAVRCWGAAGFGQIGTGNTDMVGDDETPASVPEVDFL